MSNSSFFKKLTAAEVGNTKTHEVYIRIPNDFDFESFFNNTHEENGSVIEVNFVANVSSRINENIGPNDYNLRFVFFANSNKEKRIPGLGPLFKEFEVKEGDVVCLERNESNKGISFNLTFLSPESLQVYNGAILLNDALNKPKSNLSMVLRDEPLQIIYYGAPGTGKSYAIDNATAQYGSVRTTFHPDSDYASFVGAYKPTMEAVPINSIYGESVQYATGKNGHPGTEKKIVYKYVPQAFLKAYVAAWSDLDNPHYLVIEEINRGNCAQIFGDLFQLLDRNNSGSSSYAIHADDDIRQFLSTDSKGFANLSEEQKQAIADFVLVKDNRKRSEIGPKILSGELLLLPPNLRIWATMNTSDQSLFPIDSAFKRRWNWHFVPIEYDVKDWLLHVGDNYYRWGDFLRAINPIISELTESPDKQMGYFFAKPDEKHGDTQENNTISEDVFVNKVLFYLWTDVLKDFDAGKEPFLNPDTKRAYEFSDFFDSKHDYLEQFVGKLGISPIDGSEPVDEEATDKGSDYKSIEVSVDGQTETSMTKAMIAILQKAAPTHTFAEIEAAVSECITRGDDPIIKKIDNPTEYTKENRWNTTIIKSSDNICFVVTTMWQRQFLPMIKKLAQYFNVPFEVVNP